MIAICTACIKDKLPEDLKILATANGLWTGVFTCHVCGRFSVYTFGLPLPVSLHKLKSELDRIEAVINFLADNCSEEKWRAENIMHYRAHVIKYVPFVNKNAVIDRMRTPGLLFKSNGEDKHD